MKKFKVGDRVRCIKHINFSDNTYHRVGQIITIDEVTIYYYNHPINSSSYEKYQDGENSVQTRLA